MPTDLQSRLYPAADFLDHMNIQPYTLPDGDTVYYDASFFPVEYHNIPDYLSFTPTYGMIVLQPHDDSSLVYATEALYPLCHTQEEYDAAIREYYDRQTIQGPAPPRAHVSAPPAGILN